MVTSIPHIIAICAAFLATPDPTQESPTSLELDEPYRDRIALNDPPIVTPTLETLYVKAPTVGQRFTFEATETRRYEISLVSYLFDSYLTLRTSNGKLLAENDDGPISTHALLPFEATKGETYVIEAGALHGHAGPFELIVRHAPASAPAADFAWLMDQYVRDEHERLRAYEIEYGPAYSGTAVARVNLGAAYYRTFQRHKALEYFQAGLVDYEMTFGPRHHNIGTLIDNIALASVDFGNYEFAEDLQRRAIHIFSSLDRPPVPSLARSHHNLGRTLLRSGKIADARVHFRRALELGPLNGPTDLVQQAATLAALALTCTQLGDLREADDFISDALLIVESLPPHQRLHPGVISLRFAEIQHKLDTNRLDEAQTVAEELVSQLRAAPNFGLSIALSVLASTYTCLGSA